MPAYYPIYMSFESRYVTRVSLISALQPHLGVAIQRWQQAQTLMVEDGAGTTLFDGEHINIQLPWPVWKLAKPILSTISANGALRWLAGCQSSVGHLRRGAATARQSIALPLQPFCLEAIRSDVARRGATALRRPRQNDSRSGAPGAPHSLRWLPVVCERIDSVIAVSETRPR